MATSTLNYTTSSALAVTNLASLADGGWWHTASQDNSSNKYIDALYGGKITLGTIAAGSYWYEVYGYGSWDGTEFTAGVPGTDSQITWGTSGSTGTESYLDLRFLGSVAVNGSDDAKVLRFGPYSLGSAFGGILPIKHGLVIRNKTGVAFAASGHEIKFSGIKFDTA